MYLWLLYDFTVGFKEERIFLNKIVYIYCYNKHNIFIFILVLL